MPQYSDHFNNWGPIISLWAVWNERESSRAALTQKDAEIAALKKRIAELENTPPPPPPPQPYDDRVQVLWAVGLVQSLVESVVLNRDLSRIHAVVVTADVRHKIWGPPLLRRLKDAGCSVFAYVRAPVHVRVGDKRNHLVGPGAGAPFEDAVYNLVAKRDAWVYGM